jgi:hypothetical protein
VPYHEVGFWASYREVASFLHEVSAPARRGDVDEYIRQESGQAA